MKFNLKVVIAGLVLVVLAALVYALLPNDLSALRERAQGLIDSVSRKEPAPEPVAGGAPTAAPAAAEAVFPPGATPQQVMNPQALAPAEMAPAPLAAPASPSVSQSARLIGTTPTGVVASSGRRAWANTRHPAAAKARVAAWPKRP